MTQIPVPWGTVPAGTVPQHPPPHGDDHSSPFQHPPPHGGGYSTPDEVEKPPASPTGVLGGLLALPQACAVHPEQPYLAPWNGTWLNLRFSLPQQQQSLLIAQAPA